jgi:hypothetical protein
MPRTVNYYVDQKGIPRSASSGAALKKGVANTVSTIYRQVDPPLAELKKKRQARAETARTRYLANYDEYAPASINELTQSGIRYGASRDSLLRALNTNYARTKNIPLNPQNRIILNAIYADEMTAAIAAREADFDKFKGRFVRGRGKRGKVPTM